MHIDTILPQAVAAARQRANTTRAAALSPDEVNAAKWRFLEIADDICPGFHIRPEHRPVVNDLLLWTLRQPGSLPLDKGIWLYGNIGTGKSTLMQILERFANDEKTFGQRIFRISRVPDVCKQYQTSGYSDLDTYIRWKLQCFDEVGAETIPTGYFGTPENVMAYILQERYESRSDHLTLVTSNIPPSQISQLYGDRVFDRVRQMCSFIPLMGESFRKNQ